MCETKQNKYRNEFTIKHEIGKGGFGKVYKVVQNCDQTIHAIKIIEFQNTEDENFKSAINEIKSLCRFKSDYVVHYVCTWIEEINDQVKNFHIQMGYCDRNLRDVIEKKSKLFADESNSYGLALINYFISYEILEEIICCLQYVHSLEPPIIHRDLKPENILISDTVSTGNNFLKLCDFGLAKCHNYSGQSHTQERGTLSYMSPEVSQSKHYDIKTDIYSVGLIAQDLFGVNVFDDRIEAKNERMKPKNEELKDTLIGVFNILYRERPDCPQLLTKMRDHALTDDEVLQMNGAHNEIQSLIDFELKFFHNFFTNKIYKRLSDENDHTLTDTHPGGYSYDENDRTLTDIDPGSDTSDGQAQAIERLVIDDPGVRDGDIIAIKKRDSEETTIWAVYLGNSDIVYVSPKGADRYSIVMDNILGKCYEVNNLCDFAQTRGLGIQETDAIKRKGIEIYEKYENQVLDESRHNLRIHFVTKCRFGTDLCEECDGFEQRIDVFD